MSDKINIAELNIDVDALIKSAAEVKAVLDQARAAQTELTKAGQTASVQYVQNAADIKSLSGAYNLQIAAITKHTKAVIDQTSRQDLLNTVIGQEVQSIEEAREQNKLLNQMRNQTNVTTAQGREELIKLNEQLDRNNAFIKDNADSYLQQKINIGSYRDDIKGAFDDLNIFNGGLSGMVERSNEAGGAGAMVKNSFTAMTTGIAGATKASIAFIATPLGATIAALVAVGTILFAMFKTGTSEMNKTSDGANELNKVYARLSALLQPLTKWFKTLSKDGIELAIKSFNTLYDWAMKAVEGLGKFMTLVGAKETGAQIQGWANNVQNVSKAQMRILDLQNEYNKKSREAKLLQLEYQRDAEKLRQIRDDESKSIDERMRANTQLGALLKKQMSEELAIQMINLRAIEAEIKLKGNLIELEDARIAALTEIADIQERITGQESEQKTNAVSLRKEAADAAKARSDEANQRREEAKQRAKEEADEATNLLSAKLRLMVAEKSASDNTLAELLKTAEEVHKRKLEIIDAEYNASEKRNSDVFNRLAAIAEAETEIEKTRSETALKLAEDELATFIQKNQSKLDANVALTDQTVAAEKERLSLIEANELAFLQTSLANIVISQSEYERQAYDLALKGQQDRVALDQTFKDQKAIADALDLQNRLATLDGNFILEYELKTQQLEMQRQKEIEEAEKTGADKALINQKYAALQLQQDQILNKNKLSLASDTFGNLATLFGEHSRAGKAMAVMQATIDTYQSAVSAYKSLAGIPIVGPALGAVAAGAAVATGLANVKKITSTKEPKFADGGIWEVGGRLHRDGGTKFTGSDGSRFEAEQGEGIGILSRGAFSAFKTFNNRFRNGLDDVVNLGSSNSAIDVYEAIRNMPAPVVFVEDIVTTQTSYVKAINYADL